MLWLGLIVLVLAAFVTFAWQIDDWSRDLTTNQAATSADANDPLLRTQEFSNTVDDVKQAVIGFAEQTRGWRVVQAAEGEDGLRMSLTRTTRIFRFVDDVEVIAVTTEEGCRVDVASQSRVGKGDLGQNPRNVRMLVEALREQLSSK